MYFHCLIWDFPSTPVVMVMASPTCLPFQGNIVAIKYTNKKRVELSRKVLFELKHVSVPTAQHT